MKSRFKKSNSWSQLYPHFFPYLSFSIFRITHNSTHFRFDNRYRCGFNSGTFPLKEKTRAIQRGTSPHYWASEKLFLFVFNESKSMSRVVDKSEELNKRSILPYRIQFHASLLNGVALFFHEKSFERSQKSDSVTYYPRVTFFHPGSSPESQ